ncbi:MAG: DUF4157 domain-containing protein, partial [Anaerolineales bacterium]|nr:DUF4157 domain-containing protein [Anaerolineales bacterium]
NDLAQRIQRQQGGGQQLPSDVRGQMESGFDTDFEDVRVHTNGEANQLSRSLGAAAFTTDNDIFFREGHYNPQSGDGQKLLAHELTHVVQQRGASGPQRKSMTVNEPDDPYEKEADSVAEQVVGGQENAPAPTASAPEGEGGNTAVDKPEENPADLIHEAIEDPQAANDTAEEKLKAQEQQPQEEQLADEDVTEEDKERKAREAKQTAQDGQREAKDKAKTQGEEEGQKEEEKQKEQLQKGEEQKPPDKKSTKEDQGGKEGQLKIPGAEAFNGDFSKEKLFNPEIAMGDLEEPEMPPLLPTWDELAEGTIQMSPLEGVQEELTAREEVTGEETDTDLFGAISSGESFGISGKAPEAAEAETPEQAKSGEEMANDALKEGALEGFKAGVTDFAKDQAIQLATAKIPYADGMISFVQLASDPKKWVEDNVFAVGNSAKAMADSFGSIGDETNGWGYIAATLESLIALIDFINSIVGLINTIFTMVLFAAKIILIFSNFMIGLAPVGTPPPIFPFAWTPGVFTPIATFMSNVIAFLDPINNVLSAIGNILINIKFGLQPLAVFFRYMDMREFKGDPEELEKKQAKLKGNVSGFVSTATTKTANNLKDKAVDGVKQRTEQKRAKKEIEGLEAQQATNRLNQADDPDLNAKVAAKKEKFASQFGEGYDEYKSRKGAGEIVKKGLADTFGVRTHTDPTTGKVKVGRSFDKAGNDVTGSGGGKKKYFDSDAGVVGAVKKTGMNIIMPAKGNWNLKKIYADSRKDIQTELAGDTAKYKAMSKALGGDKDPNTITDPVKRQKYEEARQKRDEGFTKQEDNATTRKARQEENERIQDVTTADQLRQQTSQEETNLRQQATQERQTATQRDQDADRLEQRAQTKQDIAQQLRTDSAQATREAQGERQRATIIDGGIENSTRKIQDHDQTSRQLGQELSTKQQKLTEAQEENKQLALAYYKKGSGVTKEDVDNSQRKLQQAHDEVKKTQKKLDDEQNKLRQEQTALQQLQAQKDQALLTAQQKDELARRKTELANRRTQEATEATQQAQQARQEANTARQTATRKEASADTAHNSVGRHERELFEARKNKYKEDDWDYNQTTKGKVINWFTTVEPTGGQRHGPGALGKNLIGWVEGYSEFSAGEKAYAADRAAVDKAQTHYAAKEYAAAWELVKALDAAGWQSTADDASSEKDLAITFYQTKEDYQKLADDITTLQTNLQKVFGTGNQVGAKNNISLAITAEFDNDTSYRTLKFASTPFVAKVMSADGEELLSHNVTNIPLDGTAEEVDLYSYLTVTQGKFYLSLTPSDVRLVLDGRDGNGDGNYFEEVYKPTAQHVENTTADDGAQHSDITVRYTRERIQQGPKFQTAAGLPAATAGSAYTADITADDPDGDNSQIDFMLDPGGDKPNWLGLTKNGNGTATLTGTPPEGTSGTQTATVWIFDQDGLLHSRQFVIEVTAVAKESEGTAQTKLIQRQATGEDDELSDKSDGEIEQEIQTGESLTAELSGPVGTAEASDEEANDPIDIELEAAEQAEAEQEEEDEDAPSLSELITAARMTQMIDELPEPPENAIDTIQQNAVAFAHLTGEEYDLYLERQQLGQLQDHAQGQQKELEGTQAINQMNKQGVDKQIADAQVQQDTQEEMKEASANQQEQAQESSEQGGLFDSLFSDIFGGIMQGFGLGSAVGVGGSGDAGAVNSGSKETSKTTEDTNQVVKNSPAHMDERQNRTKKVEAEAQQSRSELDGLDNLLDQRQTENEEGMDILSETQDTNAEEQDAVAEEKQRLQDEHLETLDEAVMWASDHRMVREDIFSQLEDDLSNDPSEQEETLEQISF